MILWSPSQGWWSHFDGTPIVFSQEDAVGVLAGLKRLFPKDNWELNMHLLPTSRRSLLADMGLPTDCYYLKKKAHLFLHDFPTKEAPARFEPQEVGALLLTKRFAGLLRRAIPGSRVVRVRIQSAQDKCFEDKE